MYEHVYVHKHKYIHISMNKYELYVVGGWPVKSFAYDSCVCLFELVNE